MEHIALQSCKSLVSMPELFPGLLSHSNKVEEAELFPDQLASLVLTQQRLEFQSTWNNRKCSIFFGVPVCTIQFLLIYLMDPVSESDNNNEDWMSTLPEKLWDIPLSRLAIPGSHDAMSYCLDITSPLVRSESDSFRLVDGVFYCFTRPLIYKWATTQMKSIVEQLQTGIRYLDLRIAHKPYDTSNDLYFTHVIYTQLTVVDTLHTVATWLLGHPKEIVILACSHFEGLSEKHHEEFIYSIKKIFGSKLCPHNADITLRGLWSSGHQVVLSYDDQAARRHNMLWHGLPYWWANKAKAEELLQYLDWQKELGRPDGFFVAGLNLTADRCFIASHPRASLQTLTTENWECIRRWLEDQKPGADSSSLNIIAGDFVGAIPVCSLIIALNKKLLKEAHDGT